MPNIPLSKSQFIRLLDKRLTDVEEQAKKYSDLQSMRSKLFRVINSDRPWEEYYSVGSLPDIPEHVGQLAYLPIYPGYHTLIEPKHYAAGVQISQLLLEDKQYDVLEDMASELVMSAERVKEKQAVRAFAYAFSSAFDYMQSEEGVALCSSSHTTKSGTSTSSGFDNAGTSALSKTSLAATRILMRQFRNDISERIDMSENYALIVPDNLYETAWEIVNTPKGYNTGDGNANMQYQRYEIIPYPRLDDYDTNNWFLVNKDLMARDLLWINRIDNQINHDWDFETFASKISIRYRVAYGHKDWRWVAGHLVS